MLAVILAFYAPCNFALPKKHLADTLLWLEHTGLPVVLAQVVKPGQEPQYAPPYVRQKVFKTDSVMFFKECLWNLAVDLVPECDKLCFLDADVRFSDPDIFTLAADALDKYDIIQPYENAIWVHQNGDHDITRKSAAYALANKIEPHPGHYHPGFSWCMTRDAFARLGGFYSVHPLGCGDTALAYSLDARWAKSDIHKDTAADVNFWNMRSFKKYSSNGMRAKLRVGYLNNIDAEHLWHGTRAGRQYSTRHTYAPLGRNKEYPIVRRSDGLLEWTDKAYSDSVAAYFLSRREDG